MECGVIFALRAFILYNDFMSENTVKLKSKKFAIRIVNLYKYLCNDKNEYVLSNRFCVLERVSVQI